MSITLYCVKEGSKLRVRFDSYTDENGKIYRNAYDPSYNCQFPRAIRKEGTKYSIPESDLSLVVTGGKPFYRVSYNNITILNDNGNNIQHNATIGKKRTRKGKAKVENQEDNEIVNEPVMPANIYEINECVICLESASNQIIVPCGHLCLCSDCTKINLKQCPLCRVNITSTIKRG